MFQSCFLGLATLLVPTPKVIGILMANECRGGARLLGVVPLVLLCSIYAKPGNPTQGKYRQDGFSGEIEAHLKQGKLWGDWWISPNSLLSFHSDYLWYWPGRDF